MPPLRLLKQSDLLQKSSNTMEVFQTSRDRSVVVEASAGTGKTFALEELVLELALVERIPLQKILLVTFTEKATKELRTRLRSRLREIVDAAQSGKEWLGQEGSGSRWEIDAGQHTGVDGASLPTFSAVQGASSGFSPCPFDAPLPGPCRRKPGNTEERTASIDAPAGKADSRMAALF